MAVEALHAGDIAAIAIYFTLVFGVGIWATLRPNKGSSSGYFLAGKDMTWIPIGASIFTSNVGAPMFIGLTGSAATGGIAVTIYEWHAVYMILLLGWFFLPVYLSSGCYTMPEYMKKRFGGTRIQVYFSILALVIYILIHLSAQMYAGGLFIRYLLGWNVYLSSFLLLALTALFTVAGGLTAVMWTDTLQAFILIFGGSAVSIMSLIKVGGYESLTNKFMASAASGAIETNTLYGNLSCAIPRDDSFHLWRDAVLGDLPWPGMVFGLTANAMFFWCNDQVMVQRTLAAKNLLHAKGGAILASYMKLTSFFLFIIPGLASRVLYPDYVACASPSACTKECGSPIGCSNFAYPLLMVRILPAGVTGLVIAALLSALMSSLTSVFNSASSVFTIDIWGRLRPHASEGEKMVIGRLFILLLAGISMAWLPMIENAGESQLWNYMQAITSYIVPPWAMCFLLAVIWNRMTEQGAFWGLMISLVVGIIRMVLGFLYTPPLCGSGEPDLRPPILSKVQYLHFGIILCVVNVCSTVAISLFTPPRSRKQLSRVTWWTRNDDEEEPDGEDQDAEKTEDQQKTEKIKESLRSRVLFWFCGVHSDKSLPAAPKLSSRQRRELQRKLTNVSADNSWWPAFVNANAVICLCVVTFLLGFFY